MKLSDKLKTLAEVAINANIAYKVETAYICIIPDYVKKIISIDDNSVFYDDRGFLRKLSTSEILNATEQLHIDFIGISLLPIFDIGDNDFIVYDLKERCWYLFNIVDEIKFKKAANLTKYL